MSTLSAINAGYSRALNFLSGIGWIILGFVIAVPGLLIGMATAAFAFTPDHFYWLAPLLVGGGLAWGGGHISIKWGIPLVLPRFSDAAGVAKWGSLRDLKKANLLDSSGDRIYCGKFGSKRVYYSGDRHIITVGMTGTGKDTRFLVPNLKHLDGRSVLVLDPKGEQAAITARHRSKLGPVFALDPTGLLMKMGIPIKSSGFNPMVNLRVDDPLFYDKATDLAESSIKADSISEKHWPEGAEAILSALIMRAKLGERENRNCQASFGLVNEMLSMSYDEFDDGGLRKILKEINSHEYRPMAKLVGRFLGYSKENKSFISVALNNMRSLNSPAFAADLEMHPTMKDGPFKGRPFDFEMMKHQVITVYVILPDDMFETHAVWMRLVIANALNSLKRTLPGKIRPILMLNEIGNLGYLKPLMNGIGMARGKGITIWTLFQSLEQIVDIYGKSGAAAFKSGAGVFSALRVNDPETAHELAQRAGHRTVVEMSYNSDPDSSATGKQERASGYNLLRPEGFLQLKDGEVVSWIDSIPFKLNAPGYWEMPGMSGLDKNPYHVKAP